MAGLITSVSGWLGFGEEAEVQTSRPGQQTAERHYTEDLAQTLERLKGN